METSCIKKRLSLTLAFLTFFPVIFSFEFREPLTVESGPIRYFFEEPDESLSLRWWSSGYARYARKAFSNDHGRHFEELPSLFFNKADLRVCHIFKNCFANNKSEFYNPLLRTAKLRLRADYIEGGAKFGAKIDYPLGKISGYQGRIGIRASVPLKHCKVDKWDEEGVRQGAELQDVIAVQPATINADNTVISGGGNFSSASNSVGIRLDFAEALNQSADRTPAILYNFQAAGATYQVMGPGSQRVDNEINGTTPGSIQGTDGVNTALATAVNSQDSLSKRSFALVYSPEGLVPRPSVGQNVVALPVKDDTNLNDIFKAFPKDAKIQKDTFYVFSRGDALNQNYKGLAEGYTAKGVEQRVADQDSKASVWLIPFGVFSNVGGGFANPLDKVTIPGVGQGAVAGTIGTLQQLSQQVTENVYEWLHDRGMDFERFTTDDIGDVQSELFVEASLNDKLLLEGNVGVVFPTGKQAKYKNNPYQIYPGNGGHWEVSFGTKAAFRASRIVNIKADAKYNFVLRKTEERAATFAGSIIKNIGPKVDAEVKWEYFTGNLDINFNHPGTQTITGTLGYQLWFKREESLKFAKDKMTDHWLGKVLDTATGSTTKGQFIDDSHELDAQLAVAHTKAISHRLRFEASYLVSEWIEAFWGGGWTFAGKNSAYMVDAYFGFHIAL